jgi:hypothetical protein
LLLLNMYFGKLSYFIGTMYNIENMVCISLHYVCIVCISLYHASLKRIQTPEARFLKRCGVDSRSPLLMWGPAIEKGGPHLGNVE